VVTGKPTHRVSSLAETGLGKRRARLDGEAPASGVDPGLSAEVAIAHLLGWVGAAGAFLNFAATVFFPGSRLVRREE